MPQGYWNGKHALFIGDSLTARKVYPEVIRELLGIIPHYHCKGGAGLRSMVDGDNGLGGDYDNETDAGGILRPLMPEDVAGMDLIVFYGGYNNRNMDIGQVGDRFNADGTGAKTVAGYMQHAIDRIYDCLAKADNLTCRILIVTVDCSGKYPWVDATGYEESEPGTGRTLEAMADIQKAVAAYNAIPCCDLFHTSGINRYTWHIFGASADPVNHSFSPCLLDAQGVPTSQERIRYVTGQAYYQHRDGKVILEKYEGAAPYPYIGDQLHKSYAGYRRIGEVIAGAVISSYSV